MKKSFLLHLDSLCILEELDDVQKGQLFNAIYKYQLGEEIELTPLVKIAFSQFKNQFQRDNEKYKKVCEARKQAGSVGGKQRVANQANASKSKQDEANQADNKNKNKSDSDNVKDKEDNFTFFLKKKTQYGNLSLDYKVRLKRAIEDLNMTLSHDDFQEALEAKGYTYQNFLSAYKNWAKKDFNNTKPKQQYKKFEDMTLEEKMEYNEAEKQRKIEANYGR